MIIAKELKDLNKSQLLGLIKDYDIYRPYGNQTKGTIDDFLVEKQLSFGREYTTNIDNYRPTNPIPQEVAVDVMIENIGTVLEKNDIVMYKRGESTEVDFSELYDDLTDSISPVVERFANHIVNNLVDQIEDVKRDLKYDILRR